MLRSTHRTERDRGWDMSEDAKSDVSADRNTGTARPEDARSNRTIRYSGREWEEVRQAAILHDMPAAKFVRETVLAVARNPGRAVTRTEGLSLAPLIERMFRYTWFPATERRDAMIREECKDEVDALVADSRALHDRLRGKASD